ARVREEPFTLALVELTDLGKLNRRDGLESGDAALVAAAHVITHAADQVEGSACRYSGARLALLIPAADSTSEAVLTLLRDQLEALDGQPRCAATAWRPDEEGHDVLARAREALRAEAQRDRV
ncbi:MAG: Diguanylate cyclase, domain, partial [Solirubrobacterales bacterium]|nr:Diguanylate cyclase, domain [Solirubrobacterales bacterium]